MITNEIPTAWTLVPKEATANMIKAGGTWSGLPAQTWTDMVDAAPAAPAPQSVSIKALEWDDRFAINEDQEEEFVASYAKEPMGLNYHIEFDPYHTLDWILILGAPLGNYATADEAKAGAQSDFESRIRSALSALAPTKEMHDAQ